MTSDCYAILGVHPAAEDVVIRAAYRALMRHYHPDTNSDPEAQARARAITAAYAVLRDPARRAEYDADRAAGDLWAPEEEQAPRQPPAMRTVGIATAALALALVAGVWTMAEKDPSPVRISAPQPAKHETAKDAFDPGYDAVPLEPESERLARLREESEILAPAPPAEIVIPPESTPAPAAIKPALTVAAPRALVAASGRAAVQVVHPTTPPRPALAKPKPAPATPVPKTGRIATLETMAAGFFSQSMVNADAAKKVQLLSARDRSAAKRKSCASDSCVADAYVRQIRETSAIMEGRTGSAK